MRKGDAQIGAPQVLYKNTKANIEAMTGFVGGEIAYATDTGQDGIYDAVHASWTWGRAGGGAPATTAADDFQVGDGAGAWIKKTLAQTKTILGIFADAASDSVYYVRRNAAWTNAKTYFDTLYAALSHTHAASDIASGTIDNARLGIKPAFSVHKNGTDQTGCTSGASTKLTWSTEVYDTNNNFASDKFTPTVAGKYLFIVSIRMVEALGAANYFNAQLYKNGSPVSRSAIPVISSTHPYPHAYGTFLVDANGSTDYFEVYVQHDSPSGNRTVYGYELDTYFQGYLAVPA